MQQRLNLYIRAIEQQQRDTQHVESGCNLACLIQNRRDSLLEELGEEIFNALVEKIEILTPTQFILS